MTLDEWKAQQKKTKSDFNLRRPGEGCDDSQWKKMYVLKKKPVAEEGDSDEEDEEVSADL
jgi:plasminogen activator inhibitor 1 RNA-binding protein